MLKNKVVGTFLTKDGRQAIVKFAESEDAQGICAVIRDRREDKAIRENEPIVKLTEDEREWWANIETQRTATLVVQLDHTIVGQVTIGRDERCPYETFLVYSIDVMRPHRSNGLGRILLNCAIAKARKTKDIEIVELWATVQNTHAVSLYKSAGFTQKGEILKQPPHIKWCGQPCDRINMIFHFSK